MDHTALPYTRNCMSSPKDGAPSVCIDYAADGTKLTERPASVKLKVAGATAITPPVVVPEKQYFGAGYVNTGGITTLYTSYGFFTTDGTFHAYIPDSRGNVAAVVNASTGAVEQQNSYYPYGATTSQSTGADINPLKFGGKELTTLFGRHEYDFSARMYAPLSARFSSPDRKAWDYPWLSPYCFCAADPINYIDPTGMDWVTVTYESDVFVFYHPDIKSKDDINKIFGKNSCIEYLGESGVKYFTSNIGISRIVVLNADGSFSVEGWDGSADEEYDNYGLHVGNDKTTDISKINQNRYGTYVGDKNPTSVDGKKYSYAVPPSTITDYRGYQHDRAYDRENAEGLSGVLFNNAVTTDDWKLVLHAVKVAARPWKYSSKEVVAASGILVVIGIPAVCKSPAAYGPFNHSSKK